MLYQQNCMRKKEYFLKKTSDIRKKIALCSYDSYNKMKYSIQIRTAEKDGYIVSFVNVVSKRIKNKG